MEAINNSHSQLWLLDFNTAPKRLEKPLVKAQHKTVILPLQELFLVFHCMQQLHRNTIHLASTQLLSYCAVPLLCVNSLFLPLSKLGMTESIVSPALSALSDRNRGQIQGVLNRGKTEQKENVPVRSRCTYSAPLLRMRKRGKEHVSRELCMHCILTRNNGFIHVHAPQVRL